MISATEFEKMKKTRAKLEKDKQRTIGSLKQLKAELLDLFDCKTLKEAEELLQKKQSEVKTLQNQEQEHIDAFREQWSHLLEEIDS